MRGRSVYWFLISGGSSGRGGCATPPSVQYFSFSGSFGQKLCQRIGQWPQPNPCQTPAPPAPHPPPPHIDSATAN